MGSKFDFLSIDKKLEERKKTNNFRKLVCVDSRIDNLITIDGSQYINFSSNDYLGLSTHPKIKEFWQQGLDLWGAGSGASPLVTGFSKAHKNLQDTICEWLGFSSVILFNSGFAANQAIVKAINNKNTSIYADRLSHASLQEASLLSGARLNRFHHNDVQSLSRLIKPQTGLIITEGVFSMDGDEAPLVEIKKIADETCNIFLVDDAHGIGVHGHKGKGTLAKQNMKCTDVDIFMSTFGKAIGTMGAFVAGSNEFIEYMINFSREYIYSTHMPPSVAYVTQKTIEMIQSDSSFQEKLKFNVDYFKKQLLKLGFPESNSTTSIQPIVLGSSEKAILYSELLREHGCYVGAIRPPTVPQNTARLRITITANHTLAQIDQLIEGLENCLIKIIE